VQSVQHTWHSSCWFETCTMSMQADFSSVMCCISKQLLESWADKVLWLCNLGGQVWTHSACMQVCCQSQQQRTDAQGQRGSLRFLRAAAAAECVPQWLLGNCMSTVLPRRQSRGHGRAAGAHTSSSDSAKLVRLNAWSASTHSEGHCPRNPTPSCAAGHPDLTQLVNC